MNRSKWLDRHVYTENLREQENSPTGDGSDATDQPGLRDMTLKAIKILHEQAKKNDTGFFLMYVPIDSHINAIFTICSGLRRPVSIRYECPRVIPCCFSNSFKMMHALDYDRALGELLELDDTIRATIQCMLYLSCTLMVSSSLSFADLKEIGEEENTLIVVTADHGHGFVRFHSLIF